MAGQKYFELAEFDWFDEGFPPAGKDDYEGLVDLEALAGREGLAEREVRPEMSEMREGEETVRGETDSPEAYGGQEDGLAWRFEEGLCASMHSAFDSVSEKLCGVRLTERSDYFADYMEQLENGCVVIPSRLGREGRGEGAGAEAVARIRGCFAEDGCVLAAVSDSQWRELAGEPEGAFADSGLRTLQVIGLTGQDVIVNDYASPKGKARKVPCQDFCSLCGTLLEVYK